MPKQKNIKYFVRIDKKIKDIELDQECYKKHLEYLKKISSERIFLGGGFTNVNGGMIIFKAKDMKEAESIAQNDPLFESGAYSYGIFEWEVLIASKNKI